MAVRYRILLLLFAAITCCWGCEGTKPEPEHKPEPVVILKPRPKLLTAEQKAELGFPPEIIAQVEQAAGAPAEPFLEDVMLRSSNLKGDVMITSGRLSGFSVHARNADQIISDLWRGLRSQGFLIFRSEQNVGSVPDVVTVVRGGNTYDILKVQRTEAPHYHLDTKAIIAWLKEQQKQGPFVITGAGADWVEASFVRPPKNMGAFARRVVSFAPDVLREGPHTVDKLADRMAETNGFHLLWD
jgi:hypothetical protein